MLVPRALSFTMLRWAFIYSVFCTWDSSCCHWKQTCIAWSAPHTMRCLIGLAELFLVLRDHPCSPTRAVTIADVPLVQGQVWFVRDGVLELPSAHLRRVAKLHAATLSASRQWEQQLD
mmetsp:Transcript_76843/g.193298  ORF Transcript_76843/g.193298 Transcript_76843/m.193298 type:complete len:118 (+) Transcript_76843:348-701(+)